MAVISYHDIKYYREMTYFNRLKPVFDDLLRTDFFLGNKVQAAEEEFYFQLSNSVKVDNLEYVSELLKKILARLKIDLHVDIFIYLTNIPNALCIPRYNLKDHGRSENIMILVSQHFFNDLNSDEQAAILGHEIGHYLFGHIHIPKDVLLKYSLPILGAPQLKSDLLKWGICTEISADIIGLVACGLDSDAFISALVKYTTGLNNSTYYKLGGINLKNTVFNQFKEITNSLQDQKLSTHPITPLRLKLAEILTLKDILKKYGTECSQDNLNEFKNALNSHIDQYVSLSYPDILPDFRLKGQDILLKMAIAVSLSDSMISQKEFEMIRSFAYAGEESDSKQFAMLDQDLKACGNEVFIRKTISDCVNEGLNLRLNKPDIIQIIRNLLIIAVADGFLHQAELQTIAAFALPFGISNDEIIFLKNHMKL